MCEVSGTPGELLARGLDAVRLLRGDVGLVVEAALPRAVLQRVQRASLVAAFRRQVARVGDGALASPRIGPRRLRTRISRISGCAWGLLLWKFRDFSMAA